MDHHNGSSELLKCNKHTPKFSFNGQTFLCKCVSVYDGDTISVVFQPYDIYCKFSIRLTGIDTPEVRTKNSKEKKQGLIVRDFLRKLILNKLVIIKCGKFDKYGRLLADVFQYDEFGKEIPLSINDLLIKKKYAYAYDGGTKQVFK